MVRLAVSRMCYNYPQYKYHLNDIDEGVIEAWDKLRDGGTWFQNLAVDMVEKVEIITTDKGTYSDRKKVIYYVKNIDCSNGLRNLIMNNCKGLVSKCLVPNRDLTPYVEFMKRVELSTLDYIFIFEKYKNDDTAFVFLDPPYLDSFNSCYKGHDKRDKIRDGEIIDNTHIFVDILNFLEIAKCRTMLIINSNAITRHLFGRFIKFNYTKVYQLTKNKGIHLVCTNY